MSDFFDDLLKRSNKDEPTKPEEPPEEPLQKIIKDFQNQQKEINQQYFSKFPDVFANLNLNLESTSRIPKTKPEAPTEPEKKSDEISDGIATFFGVILLAGVGVAALMFIGFVLFLIKVVWKIVLW